MFMIGQTVSHYRILNELGRGAMSVVYLAKDEHLKRYVAIKMLNAEHLARAKSNYSRLLREARAVSQINHPNIAVVYDYGETDDRQPFIVMEYVEGETLNDLLHRKTLSVSRSIEIIADVAAALHEAHSKGIIHRDIKPSNIIINKRGEVKVLDFGLAKHIEGLMSAEVSATAQGSAETQTREGVVVGTPLYLSPEQALGGTIDQRTDIFSLGSVFYECLTGQHPFQAASVIEICAKILRDEPPPPSKLNSDVSSNLDAVTLKALAKDPQQRYQTAKELREALGFAHKETADELLLSQKESTPNDVEPATVSGSPTTTKGEPPANTAEESAKARSFFSKTLSTSFLINISPVGKIALASLVFILTCTLGYLGFLYIKKPTEKTSEPIIFKRLSIPGNIKESIISPNAEYVASVVEENNKQTVRITELATLSDLQITEPSEKGYSRLSFSPDNKLIYYTENEAETGTLFSTTKLGQQKRKILDNVNTAASFSPDGSQIAFIRYDMKEHTSVLMTASNGGENASVLVSRKSPEFYPLDSFSPSPLWSLDNDFIVCATVNYSGGIMKSNIETVSLKDKSIKRINDKEWYAINKIAWSALDNSDEIIIAGSESITSSSQLFKLSLSTGEINKITNSTDNYNQVSVSKVPNRLLVLRTELNSSVWLISNNDVNQTKQIATNIDLSLNKEIRDIAWLSDNEIIYTFNNEKAVSVWIKNLTDNSSKRLTYEEAHSYEPTVSKDGRHVVYVSFRSDAANIWRINADGTQPTRLTSGRYEDMPQITPDKQWVVYHTADGIWKTPFSGGEAIKLLDMNAVHPAISPDGKMLACFALKQGENSKWKLKIFSLTDMSLVKELSLPMSFNLNGGLRWMPDGKGLAYVNNASGFSNVWVQSLSGGEPKRLTNFREQKIFSFAWSPDGKNIACIRGEEKLSALISE